MTDTRPFVSVYEPGFDGAPQLVRRPMNDAEYAAYEAAQVEFADAQLTDARALRTADVMAALDLSDRYVRISVETQQPMTAEQLAYRDALRALLPQIAASSDPASIALPAPLPD